MELLTVRLFLGQSKLTCMIRDVEGTIRSMKFTWDSLVFSNTPPPEWFEALKMELADVISQEHDRKNGRVLF